MRRALYDPQQGYYTRHIRTVGRRGDFTTLPQKDSMLAKRIAEWIQASRAGYRHLIEIGAGTGELACGIWKSLGWWRRLRWRIHIVDVSLPLRQKQQATLRGMPVRWHDSMESALQAAGGRALIYSNELPDAFPCRVFQDDNGRWREVFVSIAEGCESLRDAEPPDSSIFDIMHPAGQRVEVHASYREWLAGWAPHWRGGRMLTIDYGAEAEVLYHRRPRGTLRGYLLHQRLEGVDLLAAPGRCDLTCDINFTDLDRWGAGLGWKTLRRESLRDFLQLPDQSRLADVCDAFRVLEQQTS
jgi:SAM-dependent MidA family methyltransferase